jgi:heme/copper-type cytochrome/quinol oxidase subunit 2
MTNNLRKFKASLVAGIILASIFVVLASSFCVNAASSGKRGTIITLERTDDENGTLSPGDPVLFTFEVTYSLVPIIPGSELLYIPPTTVHLEVSGNDYDWITATLDHSTLQMEPDKPQIVTLTVSVTPEAPYIQDHELKITATAEEKLSWASSLCDISVTVTPDFLYFVGAYAESNYAQISPPGSYKFPITIKNDATYAVKFYFETTNDIDIPNGWAITPPNSIPVSAKSEGKVYLTVTPPYEFGNHDETIGFAIDVFAEPFPASAGTMYELTKVDTLNFQVKNFGFSLVLSGASIFVLIFGIIAILVIFIIVLFLRKSKKEKTVEKKVK